MTDSPSSRLKVVHVIGGLELGGAETLLYRLATNETKDIAHEVICLGKPEWYSSRLESAGIPVTHLNMASPVTVFRGLRALRKLLRTNSADVIQSWMYHANLLAPIAARGTGIPVVWGIHNSSFNQVGLTSRLSAWMAGAAASRLAAFVINCSQRSSQIHAELGYSAVPNAVVPNGYDPQTFRPDREARAAVRASLGLRDETFVVGCVSRWHQQKDIPNLLKAIRGAANEGVPLRCLLVGRGLGTANRELARAIHAGGCADLVLPLGERSDLPDLARAFDLHVLSSRSEAFSNVVAETMLSETPNVVTDVGDSALIVDQTGWVVRPEDADELGRAIGEAYREWATDQPAWQKRRVAARRRIAERFTFQRMAEAYRDVWTGVARPR